ncbi:MAG: hypothetical protein MRY83_07860 [Flavobacteriales bacterium]|nr:hypothetical protein [Flavobacteriales bacterium]
MWKSIFAIVGGLVSASIGIMIVQGIGHYFYPIPEGIDPQDTEQLKAYIKTAPLGVFWFLILSFAVGSLIGGLVCSIIDRNNKFRNGFIVGFFLTIAGIVQLISIPHPFWFSILSECLYIPFALIGIFLIKRKK